MLLQLFVRTAAAKEVLQAMYVRNYHKSNTKCILKSQTKHPA